MLPIDVYTIYIDALGDSEVLKPETKAVVSASAEVKLDAYTDVSKEVHEILEAKGTYVYSKVILLQQLGVPKGCSKVQQGRAYLYCENLIPMKCGAICPHILAPYYSSYGYSASRCNTM